MLTTLHFNKSVEKLKANVSLPASKSITNRALILKQLSNENFLILNQSLAEDSVLLETILKNLTFTDKHYQKNIFVNNAGTAMRFLTAFLSITKGEWILSGSERMKERTVESLVNALSQLGADISYCEKKGFPPILIKGKKIKGGNLSIKANTSSQFVTALLLISGFLEKGLSLTLDGPIVSEPYIEMTLKILKYFGIESSVLENTINIINQNFQSKDLLIESDWSAASYWYEIAAFSKNVDLKLIGLTNSGWQGDAIVAEIFKNFGVNSEFQKDGVRLTKTNTIVKEFSFDFKDYPDLAQTVAVSCAGLGIKATLTGLESLTIKECNRLMALETELNKIGCKAISKNENELIIEPSIIKAKKIIHTYNDHRMAMSFAPLAIILEKLQLENINVVKKSYPGFWNDLQKIGFSFE
ncbi:MAG: 3-phosphoshikimate 1-carboxyvinyltransferase [Bacteroidales bacterium]